MDTVTIENVFQERVCKEIRLLPEGIGRYVVLHPFAFDDGDHFTVVLRTVGDQWYLTDEGHTFMHLSYEDINLELSGYASIVDKTVAAFGIENRQGELIVSIPDYRFGDALFSFLQALVKVSDIKYLQRERVKSLFEEEFRSFLRGTVAEHLRQFEYYHPERDPQRVYPVDCRINARPKPMFVFGIVGDAKCQTVTNIIYWWERQTETFDVVGIFENQEDINRRILARFSDVCGRQFSSLHPNRDRITAFLKEHLSNGR
ncbi:MAG: DUF1828 domain-containing protein [Chloroflexi bacterium]|nr:DUF1828 domain-containing protein [Chloroflexota bacterium]